MRLLATTLSLTVPDPAASAGFLRRHFGFREDLVFDGGAALRHPDGGPVVFFLRTGLATLPEAQRELRAQGLILALTVANAEAEEARLRGEGVEPAGSMQEDEWGERSFQVIDPNGVVLQLVQWVGERPY